MIWFFLALSLSYIIGGLSWSYDIIWHHWFRWIISSLSSVVPKLIWIVRCWEHRIIKYSNTYHPYHEWSWNIIPILVVPKFHQVFRVPKLWGPPETSSSFLLWPRALHALVSWPPLSWAAHPSRGWPAEPGPWPRWIEAKKNEVQSDPIANTI